VSVAVPAADAPARVTTPETPIPPETPAPPRAARARAGGIDAEVALLDRARAALAAGSPEVALAWVDEHAREFPRGSLTDAREGTRVDALCLQGRTLAAESAAQRLLAQRPDSPLTRRFENFRCDH
jgi:hypothetical protein